MNRLFVLILIPFSFFYSCKKGKNKSKDIVSSCPDTNNAISYSNQIVPIINASCGKNSGACHNSSSTFGDFNSYQGFTTHPPSHIIHCVKQDDPSNYQPMPLGASKLSACDIVRIVNWVNQGEKNN